MYKPLALFIGLRYTRAKRRNHFISFISLISMLGIALGVTALITVLSVMNGFENELRNRILGMTAHATIQGYGENLSDWQGVRERMLEHPRILAAAPYIQREGMLINGNLVNGSVIRGIDPALEPGVSKVTEHMRRGELASLVPGEFNIVLGAELAMALGVGVGDKVTLVTPTANVTAAGILPRLKRFTVSAIFQVGMFEYDSALGLIHLSDAQKLFRMGEEVTGVRLQVDELFAAPQVVREAGNRLEGVYYVRDWTQSHSNFFRAIRTEKMVMFIILLLIVGVAAFNIVSTLVMVVTDKESDIAILKTLGATPRTILLIFIVQGTLIGVIGTLLGLIGGVSLALNVETLVPWLEHAFGVQFLPADVYYISDLPSELHWDDVLHICGVSFLLTVLATLWPARRAAKTAPAEALRYE